MVNILFTIKNLDSAGMKYVLADIVCNIDKSRFNPIILVGRKTNSSLEKKLSEICEVHEISFKNPGALRFLPKLIKISAWVKSKGHLGHSFDYSSDWFEALVFKWSGVPLISEKTNLSMSSYRWKFKLGLSTHIVCLSNAQKELLTHYSGKLSLIPTGIDIESFERAPALQRSTLGLSEHDIVLISVAHYVGIKGYEELIRAVSSLKDTYPQLKILCVGTGAPTYVNKLKQLASTSGVSNRIIFYGISENVASLYKLADGKILATRNTGRKEAYGAVIVEAMVCGLPVIATKSGGPEDLVIEGVTGWLVEGEGYEPLVNGIHKFMAARNQWKDIGRLAKKRALEHYNLDAMIVSYSELYSSMYIKSSSLV